MEIIGAILLLTIGLVIYMLPAIIAFNRNITSKIVILWLNIFTGWIIIAWICYIIWASIGENKEDREFKELQKEYFKNKLRQNETTK